MGLGSAFLVGATSLRWLPLTLTEVIGFVTGGVCVWLVVREHIWNWPIGLANNIVFAILFWHSRLYADMSLQGVYLGLGIYGWWNWLFGAPNRTAPRISRTRSREWIALAMLVPIATFALRELLIQVNGAAPFWDSLTTVLSLAAQYLLCQKRLENWWFWIAADLIYIPLYLSRRLPLTSFLYAVFLGMCIIGVLQWSRKARRTGPVLEPEIIG